MNIRHSGSSVIIYLGTCPNRVSICSTILYLPQGDNYPRKTRKGIIIVSARDSRRTTYLTTPRGLSPLYGVLYPARLIPVRLLLVLRFFLRQIRRGEIRQRIAPDVMIEPGQI